VLLGLTNVPKTELIAAGIVVALTFAASRQQTHTTYHAHERIECSKWQIDSRGPQGDHGLLTLLTDREPDNRVQVNPCLESLYWDFKLGELLKDSLPNEIATQDNREVLVYLRSLRPGLLLFFSLSHGWLLLYLS
jgi:hypothetical protein